MTSGRQEIGIQKSVNVLFIESSFNAVSPFLRSVIYRIGAPPCLRLSIPIYLR